MYNEERQRELCDNLKVVINSLPQVYEMGNLRIEVLKNMVEDYLIATSFNAENFNYEKYGSILLSLLKKPMKLSEAERITYFAYNDEKSILVNERNVLEEFLRLYKIRKENIGESVRTETLEIKAMALANVCGIREIEMPVLEKNTEISLVKVR